MPKAELAPITALNRRGVLNGTAALLVAPGAALAAAPGVAGDDPLVELERQYLAADRVWLAADRAHVDARDDVNFGEATGPVPPALSLSAAVALERVHRLRCELVAAPVTTLPGLAVVVRRLLEAEVFGTAGDEEDLIRSALTYLSSATGREQFAGFRDGVLEDLAMRGEAA